MVQCVQRSLCVDEWVRITRNQAKRLWGFDAATCDAVLERLTKSGYLRENAARMFVRDDDWW